MLLIKNGCVHDGCGNVLPQCDVLADNGLIRAVGQNLTAPGAEVFDAAGKQVLPGFVSAMTVQGATGPGWKDDDLGETSDPVTPELSVVYAFDQDNMNFQEQWLYGVTSVGVVPKPGNVLGGQMAVFKTRGRSPYEMLVREGNAMVASVSAATKTAYAPRNAAPMTRMGAVSLLTAALKKAEAYGEKSEYDAKSEALQPVLRGEMPLFVNALTRAQMDAAEMALAAFPGVQVVFTGAYGLDEGRESVRCGRCAALVGDLTEAMTTVNANVDFAAIGRLMDSGARIGLCCGGDSFAGGRESLLWNAIQWHKNGLPSERVLVMMTSAPAQILGVGDKVGSIAPGRHADLSIWSANPIETYLARMEAVFLQGENLLNKKEVRKSCW